MSKNKKRGSEAYGLSDNMRLGDARAWLDRRVSKGERCPCCYRYIKRYRRMFTSSMAYVLIIMARYYRKAHPLEWLHVPTYIVEVAGKKSPGLAAAARGDWTKMKHWSLIEKKPREKPTPGEPKKNPRRGLWRLTDLGRRFANRRVKLPAYQIVYKNLVQPSRAVPLITIDEALGVEFDYADLMRPA